MTATTSPTQMHKLQIIQNKALRFVYNTKYQEHTTNDTLHHRAKLAPVRDRLTFLRRKEIDRLNFLLNDDMGANVVYKFSDFTIEEEPYKAKSNKLLNIYMRLGLLDANNEIL